MNTILELVADHPKISQGVALGTTGASGAVQFAERQLGLQPDMLTQVGLIFGIVASAVVVYANFRRIRHDSQQNKLDAKIKELETIRLQKVIDGIDEDKKKRRKGGEPMRRKTD